jgi:carboxyl-terminal processing protease
LNKIRDSKKDDLTKHRDEVRSLLEEEIVGRYYFQKGRIEYSLKHDKDLDEALKLVREPARIKSILTTVEKPVKPFNARKKF